MIKTLLAILLIAIAAVLVLAARKPAAFRVERSLDIQAASQKIFPLVDDLQQWRSWSPYEDKDPAMQRSFSGPARGVGAAYAWSGNREVGAGRMEITTSIPDRHIVMRLDFLKPFKATNTAEFTFTPDNGGTRVTWAMSGEASLLCRVIGLFIDMDKMIGKDFEAGLKRLKAVAERPTSS